MAAETAAICASGGAPADIPRGGMGTSAISIDVWADVACPWCFLGHHRLREALADEPPGSVEVRPRAFELQPDLPPEGMAVEDFYPRRFGSVEAMREAFERVAAEAARSGLELRFDRMARAPNTRLAHRLIVLAGRHGRANDALHALFRGHFQEGADLSDMAQAAAIVSGVVPELEADDLCAAVDEGGGDAEVAAEEGLAARMEITGVPFFLAARSVALSGAHDADALRELIAAGRQAAEAA
jgi:predicted DsbA family dithiol-disulfide isomerase